MTKSKNFSGGDNDVREVLLQYFYDRNKNATSLAGKKGSSCKITDVKAALKASHNMAATQLISNLTYLISQGWIEEKSVAKSYTTPQGNVVPQQTKFYSITAAGMDKIDGPSPYTNDRFSGIRIEATGQSIVNVGNGNQVNASYQGVGEALSAMRDAVVNSKQIDEETKLDVVSDIESIQTQLAKREPNRTVVRSLWQGLERVATVTGVVDAFQKVVPLIAPIITQ